MQDLLEPIPQQPAIRALTGEMYHPYQELKERLGPRRYDAIIVFGEGPIKRVYFSDELDEKEEIGGRKTIDIKNEWARISAYKKFDNPRDQIEWLEKQGPRTRTDPNTFVIDVASHGKDTEGKDLNPYYERMQNINLETDPVKREKERENLRDELQNLGRFGFRKHGELNALAAGMLLYMGKTDTLLLSGGRTIPADKVKTGTGFPSEAEMMRDLIIRNFGFKMFERDHPEMAALFQTDTAEYIKQYTKYRASELLRYFILEDEATNSIDNVIRSINHNPKLFFGAYSADIGLLGNHHQVERCVTLLKLFTGNSARGFAISAQNDVLRPLAEIQNRSQKKNFFPELLRYMTDRPTPEELKHPDVARKELEDKYVAEEIGRDKLLHPKDLYWWLAYVAHSNVPQLFHAVFEKLKEPDWLPYAHAGFKKIGLNFDDFKDIDFEKEPSKMKIVQEKFGLILTTKVDDKKTLRDTEITL